MFELLGAFVNVLHAVAMIVWALGMPLLFWHRWPKLTRIYLWYAPAFVLVSLASHAALGECFLTALARTLRNAGSDQVLAEHTAFTIQVVELVAGVRPADDSVVVAWEIAIAITALAVLWHASTAGAPISRAARTRRNRDRMRRSR